MIQLTDMPPDNQCLRIAVRRVRMKWWRRRRREYVQCGLLWRHPGPCMPFVPGDYLPPPLLHPLDVLLPMQAWRCPLCGDPVSALPMAELVTAFRGDHVNWDRAQPEWQWTFWPCGCVVRDIEPSRPGVTRLAPPTPPA